MVDPLFALTVFAALVAVFALVVWPRKGLWAQASKIVRLTERVRLEDALKHVYTWEQAGRASTLESVAGRLEISTNRAARLLARLGESGLVQTDESGTRLTDNGRESALRLVRTHRLWERYLADRTGVPAGEWHDEAERMEHTLSVDEVEALSSRLGHPQWDPHGDPIPSPRGELPEFENTTLTGSEPGSIVEIVHLEDEPRETFDALLDRGLGLGTTLRVLGRDGESVRVVGPDGEFALSSVDALNVTVRALPDDFQSVGPHTTLDSLKPGESATVLGLAAACRGQQRRRLLDLGLVEGTEISAAFSSSAGDPMAYSIRGALIALRREQARWIRVRDVVSTGSEITGKVS